MCSRFKFVQDSSLKDETDHFVFALYFSNKLDSVQGKELAKPLLYVFLRVEGESNIK